MKINSLCHVRKKESLEKCVYGCSYEQKVNFTMLYILGSEVFGQQNIA